MIDHHVHLNDDARLGFTLDQETLSSRMTRYGVSKSIIFCSPNSEGGANPYAEQNKNIYSASLRDPRLVPFMFVHPFLDDLDTLLQEEGNFCGFKLHPRAGKIDYSFRSFREGENEILKFLMESPKPVIFHTGYRDISRIKHLEYFIQNSDKPVALAHSGDLIDGDLKLISKHDNVFVETSPMQTMLDKNYFADSSRRAPSLERLNPGAILNYLDNLFGRERVVWGSDSPWSDNLIQDGYRREADIGRLMWEKGFKSSYLNIA